MVAMILFHWLKKNSSVFLVIQELPLKITQVFVVGLWEFTVVLA